MALEEPGTLAEELIVLAGQLGLVLAVFEEDLREVAEGGVIAEQTAYPELIIIAEGQAVTQMVLFDKGAAHNYGRMCQRQNTTAHVFDNSCMGGWVL